MARTLGDLKTWALTNLHEDPASAVFTAVLVPQWAQQAVDKILTYTYWNWNTSITTLTWPAAAAGVDYSVLYLPEYIDKILQLTPTGSSNPIEIVSVLDVDANRSGQLVMFGWYWVEAEAPAASQVAAISSVAAAGNGVQIALEGLVAGRVVREVLTLAGLGVALSAATFDAGIDGVRRISLVAGTTALTGVITVTSGATVLAVLDSVWEKYHEHQRTELYMGGGAATYDAKFFRRQGRLELDTDYLPIPEPFDDLVELWIASKVGQFRGSMEEHFSLMGEFSARLREMLAWDRRQPGQRRTMYVAGHRRRRGR